MPPAKAWLPSHTVSLDALLEECDHWVAIERSGRAASGSYYTMRKRPMDELVAPLDDWWGRCLQLHSAFE